MSNKQILLTNEGIDRTFSLLGMFVCEYHAMCYGRYGWKPQFEAAWSAVRKTETLRRDQADRRLALAARQRN